MNILLAPEANPYWIAAIYTVAIGFGILAVAAFLLAVDAAIAGIDSVRLKIRIPARVRRQDARHDRVVQLDAYRDRRTLNALSQIGSRR